MFGTKNIRVFYALSNRIPMQLIYCWQRLQRTDNILCGSQILLQILQHTEICNVVNISPQKRIQIMNREFLRVKEREENVRFSGIDLFFHFVSLLQRLKNSPVVLFSTIPPILDI